MRGPLVEYESSLAVIDLNSTGMIDDVYQTYTGRTPDVYGTYMKHTLEICG